MGFWKGLLKVAEVALDVMGSDNSDDELEGHSNSMGGYRVKGKDVGHDEAEGAQARGELYDTERPL